MENSGGIITPPKTRLTTLDEPVLATLSRDLRRIATKLKYVLIPRGTENAALRDWDLWGPLIFCLVLALILHEAAPMIFVIVWLGAAVITANSQLLGGKISFFQSVCVLGYCVFPIVIAAIICFITDPFFHSLVFRLIICAIAFIWGTFASVGFLAGMVPPERKALAVYPVLLFFLVLSWLTVIHFKGTDSELLPTTTS